MKSDLTGRSDPVDRAVPPGGTPPAPASPLGAVRILSLALVLLAGAATAPLHAQVRVQGTVIDDQTLAPLSGVDLRVLDQRGRRVASLVTADDGTFRFDLRRHGGYRFQATRLGYRETTTPTLWTDGHEYFRIQVRLHPEAVLLAPIEVTARSGSRRHPGLVGFHDRKRGGIGHYFTRADVQRMRPVQVSDVVATVPGVRLASSGAGLSRRIYIGRAQGRDCPAQIYIDGFHYNRHPDGQPGGASLDDAVAPGDVEGIEVYLGLGTAPAEFLDPRSRCGVVAVWTRRGG